jgi:hypothetical protein
MPSLDRWTTGLDRSRDAKKEAAFSGGLVIFDRRLFTARRSYLHSAFGR